MGTIGRFSLQNRLFLFASLPCPQKINDMAKVDNQGWVRGTAGSVVYRRYRNLNIIQGKPRPGKQTAGSKRAASELGLSSSTAAVIRRAFQPAYMYHDGEAVFRTTGLVCQALRSSVTGSPGQRDLHDSHLEELVGMDFNASSRLSGVLQINHQVSRDADGNIAVHLPAFNPRTDVRKAAGYPQEASLYRIRLTAIAFDFREEYLEYLDMQDIEVSRTGMMEEQVITLRAKAEPGCIVLLSMSLLMYNEVPQTHEYVLLNNKAFSPCAIIAAYPAGQAAERTAEPRDIIQENYPVRCDNMQEMGYAGNRLLRNIRKYCQETAKPEPAKNGPPANPSDRHLYQKEADIPLNQKLPFKMR